MRRYFLLVLFNVLLFFGGCEESKETDCGGNNTIQLPEWSKIKSVVVAKNAIQITCDDMTVFTINGADKFTYDIGDLGYPSVGQSWTQHVIEHQNDGDLIAVNGVVLAKPAAAGALAMPRRKGRTDLASQCSHTTRARTGVKLPRTPLAAACFRPSRKRV